MSTTRSWRAVASVNQLRTAVKLEPRPEPEPPSPNRSASITKTTDEQFTLLADHTARTWTRRSSTRRWRLIVMR